MPEHVYFRDPKHPEEVHGPFTVAELKVCVMRGELRRNYQTSVDGRAWMRADEFEPELFGEESKDRAATFSAAVQEGAGRGLEYLKKQAIAGWEFARNATKFYWQNRRALWMLLAEYVPVFREHGNRREIRVSRDDEHDKVAFDDGQWNVELPDCCVVCGEPADRGWNNEQRSVPDLTWPLLAPFFGFCGGLVLFFFFWSSWSKYFIPLGLIAGFVVGYRRRGETLVAVKFRRCREHLNRTRIPRLRTYRNVLIIGVGDRAVWRQFHYGKSDIETPIPVPPVFPAGSTETPPNVAEKPASPPRTIKLVGDDDEAVAS